MIENWSINSDQCRDQFRAVDLVENDMENAEVLKTFFTSGFNRKTGLWESQAPEITGKTWIMEDIPLVEEDQAKEHINKLDTCKCLGA